MADSQSTPSVPHSHQNGTATMDTYRALTPRAHAELGTRASLLQGNTRFRDEAKALVEEGHVERLSREEQTWEVIGRSSGQIYKVRGNHCPCRTKRDPQEPYGCAHLLAIALYGWVEAQMEKEQQSMFTDEGYDDRPPVAVQDAQEATGKMQEVSPAPEISLGDPDANITFPQCNEILPASSPVHPSDLTPVDLPGGAQRTRTIGCLMQALARAQRQMKNPNVDSRGQVGNIKTRFASTPAMRNVIVAALAEEEIAILQYTYQTEHGMRCMTTLGHATGEYVSVPLDVPLEGRDSLMDRGKTIGFVKRWALQTTVVLFGEDEDEGMEAIQPGTPRRQESSASRPVPDMTHGQQSRKSEAGLRQEIEAIARQQDRQPDYIWQAAERQFNCTRDALTLEQLERIVKGLQSKGAAA